MEEMKQETLQKSLKTALLNKDAKKILSLVQNENFDVDNRDVSHDLETLLMKICFVDIPEDKMLQILDALWDREPDANLQDSVGRTALMHACISGRDDVAEFLLSKNETRVEMCDFDGNSALIPAIKSCNWNLVKKILDSPGALSLLSIYNCNGETPISLAKKSGNQGIVKIIESYQNKLIPLTEQENSKRKKKKKKDYSLPPTYSPRAEQQYSVKKELENIPPQSHCYLKTESSRKEYVKGDAHALWLTAAHLTRNTLKYEENASNNGYLEKYKSRNKLEIDSSSRDRLPIVTLPSILAQNCPPKATELKPKPRKKERKNSISLPDLRDVPGGLVSSRDNTPGDNDTTDDEFDDDDVFQTVPIQYMSPRKKAMGNSLRKSVSEKTIILPDIHTPSTGMRTPNTKRSCSEEQLNKISLLDKLL